MTVTTSTKLHSTEIKISKMELKRGVAILSRHEAAQRAKRNADHIPMAVNNMLDAMRHRPVMQDYLKKYGGTEPDMHKKVMELLLVEFYSMKEKKSPAASV